MVCQHLDKFGGHRRSSRRGVILLVCLVIKLNNVNKGSDVYHYSSHLR